MSRRICENRHPDPGSTADVCYTCMLYTTRPEYRALWGGDPEEVRKVTWPWWARSIAKLREPSDIGVGDTIARNTERFGAKAIAKFAKRAFGYDCRCDANQAWLNAVYQYKE